MGSWLPEARTCVERHRTRLVTVQVWLFSSGPLGGDDKAAADPTQLADLMENIRARDHRLFAGKLDPSSLGFGERLIAKAIRAPEGDFRDWEAIRRWADEVAGALQVQRGASQPHDSVGIPGRAPDESAS
jgi:menaquinone-dependent protoporphyrinogen oxidase